MKIIRITGKNSYIGTHFQEYLKKNQQYQIEEIETKDNEWKKANFQNCDTILHVAGIAHVSSDPKLEELYYQVNRDLAIEVAKKAKQEGCKQFIFMSSMIIYGKDESLGKTKIIDQNTVPQPENFYGDSKLQADLELQKLSDENFKVVIIRTPMVYGPNCKGNFVRLKKLAAKTPIFPNIENSRSMIYIENLCEFLKQCVDKELSGIYFPQNKEYVSTKEIIRILAEEQGKKVHFTKVFNPIIQLLSKKVNMINKVFGSKIYDKSLSGDFRYCIVDNEESIRRSV